VVSFDSALRANAVSFINAQVNGARTLKEKLEAAGKGLRPIYGNLVDKVWGSARPAAPSAPLRVHALEHAGQSVSDKLTAVRAKLKGLAETSVIYIIPPKIQLLPLFHLMSLRRIHRLRPICGPAAWFAQETIC
jgi:hypothetical protein